MTFKEKYLTESNLKIFLEHLFPLNKFIHDNIVPNSGIANRPDFRNEELKLIVEFDGYQHYTTTSYILIDEKKDFIYSNLGYRIVRIPYFIQLNSEIIKLLFKTDFQYIQNYPHGFINKKATLPADFCELGIERFKNDLFRFDFVNLEIIQSLKNKCEELKDIRLVLPKSLYYLNI